MLLHRLQQRRLGARAGAVDLVGHQQLAEDRARNEAEAALAARALLQHLAAHDVGRHQVGRELDAAGVEPEHDAHGLDQLGLGEAGKADQQCVSAAQHGDERLLDHLLLPEDHLADRGLGGGDMRPGRFRLPDDHVVELFEHFAAGCRHFIAPCHRDPSSRLVGPSRGRGRPLCPKMQHSGQVSYKVPHLQVSHPRAPARNSAQLPKDYAIFHRRDAAFLQVCHRPDTGRVARVVNACTAGLSDPTRSSGRQWISLLAITIAVKTAGHAASSRQTMAKEGRATLNSS